MRNDVKPMNICIKLNMIFDFMYSALLLLLSYINDNNIDFTTILTAAFISLLLTGIAAICFHEISKLEKQKNHKHQKDDFSI